MRHIIVVLLLATSAVLRAQTFSQTVNQPIPDDGSVVYFEIQVTGLPDVMDTLFGLEQFCLNLNHTYNEDMNLKLESPNGQIILLFGGVGGGEDNFTNTCVSNTGAPFSTGTAPYTGTFLSHGFLGSFNKGQNPNGTWKLIVLDTYAFADEGFLIDWSITFSNQPALPFVFLSSDLPIVRLTTLDQPIGDDPKAPVHMQIIDNGAGQRNYPNQTDFAYEGNIMAEWQGYTGPYYPKKNYDFELVDSLGLEMDTTILGMPRESDWIFKAEYLDRTLLKNTITYEMARRMGNYAPRTTPCEIILDDEYVGIYFLTEKIKRDKNRIDIAKLTPEDTTGSALTGGYIFEMNINGDPGDWYSEYLPINFATSMQNVEFKHVYPKRTNILPQQAEYIRNYTANFEEVLQGNNFLDPNNGYRKWIDAASFIDFLIVNEFSMNYDSYGRSTFLYKEKDSDGGLLKIGPPWDYDRAIDYGYPDVLDDWVWQRTHEYWPFPFWWSRMWEDPSFRQELACRWHNLRQSALTNDAFTQLTDSLATRLAEAQQRNFRVWNDLGTWTYAQHIAELKSFLSQRLLWMDNTLLAEHPVATFSGQPTSPNAAFWSFTPTELAATHYFWDFGDGNTDTLQNPIHQYLNSGTYTVRLTIAYGQNCSTTTEQTFSLVVSGTQEGTEQKQAVYPNPFSQKIRVSNVSATAYFELVNPFSQMVFSGNNIENADFSALPAGVYFLTITDNKRVMVVRLTKG